MNKLLMLICAAAVVFATQARTLTLKSAGSSSSPVSFTSASSWNEGYAPQPGDKIVISQANAYIGSANEEFDIGTAGLTVELRNNTTRCYVKFKGDGHLTFTTSPTITSYTLELRKACTHTGGTTIGGRVQLLTYVSNPLGTGDVTVDFTASTPRFNVSNSGATIPNNIVITGTPNARSICTDNKATFNGTITGNGGTLRIDDTYDVMTLNGAVTVPDGETITLRVNSSDSASVLVANGALNGNLAIEGVTYGSNSGRPVKLASAVCSGTKVSVNATGTLQLTSANNLNPASTVTVAAGGKINIDSGVVVRIKSLVVGGEAVAAGLYKSSSLSSVITGSGRLFVAGADADVFTWTGADAGNPTLWTSAANWDRNAVPGDGATAVFAKTATVSVPSGSTVAIGENGLTIATFAAVTCNVPFSGSGALSVIGGGNGANLAIKIASIHTGGTTISGYGQIHVYVSNPLGTGTITIDPVNGGEPLLYGKTYGVAIPNAVVVRGTPGARVISASDSMSVNGVVTGESAGFRLDVEFGTVTFNGDILVPDGKAITLRGRSSTESGEIVANGALNGDLSVEGATSGYVSRPVRLGANAICSGTNVTVNATGILQLQSAVNLRGDATVRVADGGKVAIDSGVRVVVGSFLTNGVSLAHGIYNASTLPGVLTGAGRLCVGPEPGLVIFVR